jgi:hypothetical protein
MTTLTIPDRVMRRALANVQQEGECLVSTYSIGNHGYAQIGWYEAGRTFTVLVHRLVYGLVRGPIPKEMTVDHLCRNRRCCRPSHLRLLPNVDNARDNGQRRRTHCPHGHPYTPENTRTNARGWRWCKTCDATTNARR